MNTTPGQKLLRPAWRVSRHVACLVVNIGVLTSAGCPNAEFGRDDHFSNFSQSNDNGATYIAAGHSICRVEAKDRRVSLVHEASDLLVAWIGIEGSRLFFAGRTAPTKDRAAVGALDLSTGELEWTTTLIDHWWGGEIAVTPLLADGIMIVGTRRRLYGIKMADGEVLWRSAESWFGGAESLTPVLSEDKLYYGSGEGIVEAVPETGALVRIVPTQPGLASTPLLTNGMLIYKESQNYEYDDEGNATYVGRLRLRAIDLSSGRPMWAYEARGVAAKSRPLALDGRIYDVFANRVHCLDVHSGAALWESDDGPAALGNLHLLEDLGWLAAEIPGKRSLMLIDIETGNRCGPKFIDDVWSPPMFDSDKVLFGRRGAIVCADIRTGADLWSIPVSDSDDGDAPDLHED